MRGPLDAGRVGGVLPVALILLVGLTLLATGAFVLARSDGQASVAARTQLRAGTAARGAVLAAMAAVRSDTLWPAGALFRGGAYGVEYGVTGVPLSSEWVRLEGWGVGAPGMPPVSLSRLVWRLDPLTRIGRLGAAVVAGGTVTVESGATIDGSDPLPEEDVGDAGPCRSDYPSLDSLLTGGTLAASTPGSALDSAGMGWLGPLDASALADLLPPLSSGGLPAGPLLGFVGGDARLDQAGSGLLAVAGSLTLGPDVSWAGLLLVRDRLELENGAQLLGLARVGGAVSIRSGALVGGRPCLALRALRSAGPLRRAWVVPSGSWLLPGG